MSFLNELPARATAADIAAAIAELSPAEARSEEERLRFDWHTWARREQTYPPGDWRCWLILGGRGSGKTRMAAETVRAWARDPNATIALIGPTANDVRKVMILGESGLLGISPPGERPSYTPSNRELRWPNGARGYTYSAEEPERLRGPENSKCWLDELAAYPDPGAVWDLMIPGMRLGRDPRWVASTTPKPIPFLYDLMADASTVVTRMRTWDNADNLPPALLELLRKRYSGTRIGRQELEGELLEEAEGALWTRSMLERDRVAAAPELVRIVVAIDPAVTSGENADETGIVVAGLGVDGDGYVLDDGTCRLPPAQWATRAISMLDRWNGDKIIGETNNGGEMIEQTLRTVRRDVPYKAVHASRGKTARAEPVASLYEQGRVHHVGSHRKLEDEMTAWVPGKLTRSPNRADALVWAIAFLMPAKAVHMGQAFLL